MPLHAKGFAFLGVHLGFLGVFLAILISCFISPAHATLEAPPLRVMPYENLLFPRKLDKKEVQWMLQRAMDGLYGKAFLEMGDVSDLMHGHVILKPTATVGESVPEHLSLEQIQAVSLAQRPDLQPMAILFHTHEYEYLHKGLPYDGPFGEVDPLNRNWLLFLTDTGKYHRGDLVDANEFYKKPDGSKPLTINPVDLPWELFDFAIGDWSYSFYFFRTDCDVSDQITDQEGLTLMEVYNSVKKERVCLNITSFNCRNYPDDAAHCSGQDVPLYDITKGWAPN